MTSSGHTRSSAPTSTLHSKPESRLLAAPSSFKRTIDLPPEFDDYSSEPSYAEDTYDSDDDVELQRYIEQVYMSETTPGNVDAAASGLGALGLIDTKMGESEIPNNVSMLEDSYRKQAPLDPRNYNSNPVSPHYASPKKFVEAGSSHNRNPNPNSSALKGLESYGRDSAADVLEGLDTLSIKFSSELMPEAAAGDVKGKGKARE